MAKQIGDALFYQGGCFSTGQVILEKSVCIFWQRDNVSVRAKYFLIGLMRDYTGEMVASFPDGEIITFSTTPTVLAELWRRQRLAQVSTPDQYSSVSTIVVTSEDEYDDDDDDASNNECAQCH